MIQADLDWEEICSNKPLENSQKKILVLFL